MRTYQVRLGRVVTEYAEVEVEANSPESARDQAEATVGDEDYCNRDVQDSWTGVANEITSYYDPDDKYDDERCEEAINAQADS